MTAGSGVYIYIYVCKGHTDISIRVYVYATRHILPYTCICTCMHTYVVQMSRHKECVRLIHGPQLRRSSLCTHRLRYTTVRRGLCMLHVVLGGRPAKRGISNKACGPRPEGATPTASVDLERNRNAHILNRL